MKPSAAKRGYNYRHQQHRKRLLHTTPNGTPCWWCGKPLHKTPEHNWDNKPLAADHTNPNGAKNGEPPDRLLHFTCNSQRQDGKNDANRPAMQPPQPTAKAFVWH